MARDVGQPRIDPGRSESFGQGGHRSLSPLSDVVLLGFRNPARSSFSILGEEGSGLALELVQQRSGHLNHRQYDDFAVFAQQ